MKNYLVLLNLLSNMRGAVHQLCADRVVEHGTDPNSKWYLSNEFADARGGLYGCNVIYLPAISNLIPFINELGMKLTSLLTSQREVTEQIILNNNPKYASTHETHNYDISIFLSSLITEIPSNQLSSVSDIIYWLEKICPYTGKNLENGAYGLAIFLTDFNSDVFTYQPPWDVPLTKNMKKTIELRSQLNIKFVNETPGWNQFIETLWAPYFG